MNKIYSNCIQNRNEIDEDEDITFTYAPNEEHFDIKIANPRIQFNPHPKVIEKLAMNRSILVSGIVYPLCKERDTIDI